MMKITGVASALPKHYYSQEFLTSAMKHYWGDKLENPRFLDQLHSSMCVDGRYLAFPLEAYLQMTSFGHTNTAWIKAAEELGQEALSLALSRAGLSAQDISALFVVSVTGIASPSLDARLANRMGLSPTIKRIPIFGLGCVAGAAGIARAADYVRAYPGQVAALLAVELCSLTMQRDDLTTANLIAAGLFGDGAGAVIIGGSERPEEGPRILSTRSVFYPNSEHIMGWDISEQGFRIVLSAEVPLMAERHLAKDVDAFLQDMGLTRADIGSWILHTGGPKVLEASANALDLPPEALDVSWECLRRTGNLSSASVLLVLEEVLLHRRPAPGTHSILAAMGPGFCSELVLLQW
jgi:alkylresorcinol/alkylpyrone synthase